METSQAERVLSIETKKEIFNDLCNLELGIGYTCILGEGIPESDLEELIDSVNNFRKKKGFSEISCVYEQTNLIKFLS